MTDECAHINDFFLEGTSPTITEVLRHPCCVDVYAEGNSLLTSYLCEPQRIRQMVEIIKDGPDLTQPSEKQFVLPDVVIKLFLHEIPSVWNAFIKSKEAIEILYNVLVDSQTPPALYTIFLISRIFTHVRSCRNIAHFFASKTDLVNLLLQHLDTFCIRDLFLSFFDEHSGETSVLLSQALDRQCMIQRLLKCFLQDNDILSVDVRIQTGQFICQLFYQLRLLQIKEMSELNLLLRFKDEEMTKLIADAILTLPSQQIEMLPHFLTLLRCLLFDVSQYELSTNVPTLPQPQTRNEDGFVVQGAACHLTQLLPILPRLKSFLPIVGLVYNPDDNYSISRTCRPLQPLGMLRIHVMRFLCRLVFHCRGSEGAQVVDEIAELDFIGDMVDLFFTFKWNSLMHCTVGFFIQLLIRRAFAYSPAPPPKSPTRISDNSASALAKPSSSPSHHSSTSSPSLPSLLRPYGKILYQLLIKYRFIDRLLVAWDVNENSKSTPNFRRAGYMGHLQDIAWRLACCLHPTQTAALDYPEVKDSELAAVEDEDIVGVLNCGNGCDSEEEGIAGDELLSEEIRTLECNLRHCIIGDLPVATLKQWSDFISGDLIRAIRSNNVEHLRNLKSVLSATPNQFKCVSPNSSPSIKAAAEAYASYKTTPLTTPFSKDFGLHESEFDVTLNTLDEAIEPVLSDMCVSLILHDYTENESHFDEVCSVAIKTPDGLEVGKASAGWPVICVESSKVTNLSLRRPSPPRTPPPSRFIQAVPLNEARQMMPSERHLTSSTDLLIRVFDEAHKDAMLESADTLAPEHHEKLQVVELLQKTLGEVRTLGLGSLQPDILPIPSLNSPVYINDNEAKWIKEEDDCENDLRSKLALVPAPTLSNGRPLTSVGQSRRLSCNSESLSQHRDPSIDRWLATSRSLDILNSPDLPDSDNLVLPRLLLSRDSRINPNSFQHVEALPRPIQPTMRSNLSSRMPLLRSSNDDLVVFNELSVPLKDRRRQKQLSNLSAFDD